jgi:hypothetical protein
LVDHLFGGYSVEKCMSINFKFEYETPRASVRGVFLCESVAVGCQSPVKRVTLEDWDTGAEQPTGDGDFSLPLW